MQVLHGRAPCTTQRIGSSVWDIFDTLIRGSDFSNMLVTFDPFCFNEGRDFVHTACRPDEYRVLVAYRWQALRVQ